jgi:ElaB/YqjD/DUF883 family membrane-anchored ribosome-binding protein
MGQSTDELRRDIERTRGELGETMEAIGDRVSPGRMIERRKNRLTNSVRSVRDRVMGTAHSVGDEAAHLKDTVEDVPSMVRERTEGSPLMAGAIAFGVGFLAAVAVPPSQMEREAGEKLLDKVEPLKEELTETTKEMAEHLREPAMEAAREVKDAASEGAQSVKETAADVSGVGSSTPGARPPESAN